MISRCYHICPGGKDGVRLCGQQAVAGGVLPAYHGEVHVMELSQARQAAGEESTPASPTTSPTANTWMFIAVSSFSQKDRGPDSRSLGLSSQPSCSTSMRQPSLSYFKSWMSALVFRAMSRIFTDSVTDAIRV